jgi:hypothetical protein
VMTGSNRTWRAPLIGAFALLLWVPVLPVPAWAQPQPQDTTAQETLAALRDRITRRYEVLPIQNGIVLIPRVGVAADVQSVELAGESIALNGVPATGAELRQRLGDDAETIIRLSFLDPDTRRVLFGLGAPPPAPGTPAAPDSAAVAAVPAPPEDMDTDIDIDAGEDQVRVGGSVRVGPGETIDGDVVAVGGSVRVDGRVTGDAVAVGGSVDLGPEAVVEGDAVAVGGRIHQAPGAQIHGQISEVAFGAPDLGFRRGEWHGPMMGGIGNLFGTIMWIIVLGLLTCLALLLARRPIERMEHRVRTSPWKAAAVGLAGQILFFPVLFLVVVVLAISIVGIPLLIAVPFAILALMVGTLLGFTALAKSIGHEAENRFGWDHANPYLSMLIGVGLIMAVTFFGAAIGVAGGPFGVFGVILGILGFVIQYVAWTIGFGALLLTRFGTRYRWSEEAAGTVPPSEPYEPGPAPATTSPAPPAGV